MKIGSLFSGIGGLDLGFERAGFEILWQVEKNPFCRGHLQAKRPKIRIYEDVSTIDWNSLEPVAGLVGGFPCQDLSNAGKRAGIEDGARSGLWAEYVRAIRALRPSFAVIENVPELLIRGMHIVLRDLHESGYDAQWDCLPAAAFGAPHPRPRLFIVAYPNGTGLDATRIFQRESFEAYRQATQQREWSGRLVLDHGGKLRRVPEFEFLRLVDGVSPASLTDFEREMIQAYGNAVVPQVAEFVARCIARFFKMKEVI